MYTIRMQHAAKNALGNDLMGWLESEIRNAGEQPIFLTGTADSFSAGLNLREVASFDGAAMERFLRRMDDLAVKLFLHEMGAEPMVQPKLSIMPSSLPAETTTVLLESRGKV